MAQHMLSTVDNPFNPFTQFNEWQAWDTSHGYYTLSLLARIVRTSDSLSEAQQSFAIEQGINDVLEADVLDLYVKVTKESTTG